MGQTDPPPLHAPAAPPTPPLDCIGQYSTEEHGVQKIRNQKSEVRSQKSEVRSQKSEIRNWGKDSKRIPKTP
ncbi:hypothetical protein EYC84_008758 [Monilinia fructicola]|uniref:Uncharacterized protein n=1 Tax=Monilinia fructicola TaxID=38448 RepID=A0A5M9JG84_MONFR|nr:hypothetical protein EYC84_008758 [Monilinia fructicola]